MELQNLSHEEKVVAVALFKYLVSADGVGSADEAQHVAALADAFGDEYDSLLDESRKYHPNEQEFKDMVSNVTNQESRDLIYGTVMDCADEDGVDHNEAEFLAWLAEEWSVQIKIVDDPNLAE